ncbi:MAG: phytanoyl-CoA dioxygenase family protein [Solirubrobacterales bacterium]|nr:phytanoyl-CoA dioxygenase family protein [Solirubrobacterales bacterium]
MTNASAVDLAAAIEADGYVIVEDVLSADYVAEAKAALLDAIEREAEYHGGTDYSDYGMVLLCALYGRVFTDLFDNERFLEPFEAAMGPGCTVYAYTSSSMPPSGANYSHRLHVDSPRLIPGYVTNMGATIALDDFTEENGATWFLPGSHTMAVAPAEEQFFAEGKRVVAPAGSVFFFNARLWHSGGANETDSWRHALTVNMCRPFMKQRLDIPRALAGAGVDTAAISPRARQKLGFDAQVPASYEEYYVPAEQRKFKQPAE